MNERRINDDGSCYWCNEQLDACECWICEDCGDLVIPGEGCECDFCGECGESKANGDCECEDG